jgi:uncharacterized protein (TIGR02270 family)
MSDLRQLTNAHVIPDVVQQHAEEAESLYDVREALAAGRHATLDELRRCDERLVAHIDGLIEAGEHGWLVCQAGLEQSSAGAAFTAGVLAVQQGQRERFDRIAAVAEASEDMHRGLTSALGWLSRDRLQGLVSSLLSSLRPFERTLAVAACAMHGVDPGLASRSSFQDSHAEVRARSVRAIGELGLTDLGGACLQATRDKDVMCRFWGLWSAVLLGQRGPSLEGLASIGVTETAERRRAFALSVQAMSRTVAHSYLGPLAQNPLGLRQAIEGSGIAGDPHYVPWLITHMKNDELARLAGEAVALITGTDLSALNLDRPQPEDFQSGPTDNPDDENVDMDPDEGLLWPDPEKVEKWWAANAARFQKGTRYFMGEPVTRGHCIDVLKNGYQRQRILAAHYLCLLDPGTPLFNTSAPAWRQQRLLARL